MRSIFIKYGKREHLQQIVDGRIRFSPSQKYIKLEEFQHNKGQGDLLEGKMKLKIREARIYDPEMGQLLGVLPESTIFINVQNVNNMPIFCLSNYDTSFIRYDGKTPIFKPSKDHLNQMKKDFTDATHALVIFEPSKFINSIIDGIGKKVVGSDINYYDYDINQIQMYMYLATGSEKIQKGQVLSLAYDERYRHLFCKDISFKNQQEYRFIVLDELIEEPKFYDFEFNTKYLLIPIEELYSGIEIG